MKRIMKFFKRLYYLIIWKDAVIIKDKTLLCSFISSLGPTVSGYGEGPCTCQMCGGLNGEHHKSCNETRINEAIKIIKGY